MTEPTAPRRQRARAAATLRAGRPRRGTPAQTRDRLLAAAAVEFNRVGYHGTDSNRLARAAGYAPATFYKHFPDKRALFLAAYADWVTAEWARVEQLVRAGGPRAQLAAAIVETVLAMHRTWRGLRASLRALVAADPVARAFYRAQRRRQLERLAALRSQRSTRRGCRRCAAALHAGAGVRRDRRRRAARSRASMATRSSNACARSSLRS